uniref:RBR-type E3 ubiquitin transferase n=1 Tax=Oryza punctata TaxID=4537 RepID=A0A0E0M1B1_ORYPU
MESSAAAAAGGVEVIYISSDDEDEEICILSADPYSPAEIQIQEAILLSLDSSGAAATDTAHSSASSSHPSLPDRKGKSKLLSEGDGPSESMTRRRRKRSFTCIICMDKVQASEEFLVSVCSHAFCKGCIGGYVAAKVSDNVAAIGCPDPGCEEGFVEIGQCRDIVPPELFDRWSVSLWESSMGETKCYCPFKDCSAMLINNDDGDVEEITETECPHCHRMFCASCRVPWHDGIKCKEFKKLGDDEKGKEDLMLKKLAGKKKWQRCPQCRIYVEKSVGCMFMKCRCGFRFCYNCAAPMTKEHYCKKCKH